MKTKEELRTYILQIRDTLTEEQRHTYSAEIAKKVFVSKEYKQAEMMLIYVSFRSEVSTFQLIEQGLKDKKKIFVPKIIVQMATDGTREKRMEFYQIFSLDELQEGYWGIQEPEIREERMFSLAKYNQQDIRLYDGAILIVFPGVGFDKEGNRIGYGGGFYDRYLCQLERQMEEYNRLPISKMALAYECQILEPGSIEAKTYDVKMNEIVTEQLIYVCEAR